MCMVVIQFQKTLLVLGPNPRTPRISVINNLSIMYCKGTHFYTQIINITVENLDT